MKEPWGSAPHSTAEPSIPDRTPKGGCDEVGGICIPDIAEIGKDDALLSLGFNLAWIDLNVPRAIWPPPYFVRHAPIGGA